MGLYTDQIIVSGRQPALLMLLAMVVTFVVVRVITGMIREGKSSLHNIEPGGLHIHHVVFGVVAMLLAGIVGIGFDPPSLAWMWSRSSSGSAPL